MTKKKKLIIGCTEPSAFTQEVLTAIEKFFKANPIKLSQNDPDDINHWVDQCDGVIIAGGCDIHPRTYGYSVLNEFNFSKFDVKRDMRELRIIDRCLSENIPILGICRGHQMLGVYHNMTFIPDISASLVCHQPLHQKISHAQEEPMHWVRLLPAAKKAYGAQDAMAKELFNGNSKDSRYLWVNSFHHQALLYKPDENQVVVLGTAPGPTQKQSVVEMMRGKGNKRWMSVQWHPEYDWDTSAASHMVFSKFQEMIQQERPSTKARRKRT